MLLDAALFFSDEQAVTATAVSTTKLDMGATDMGNGNPLTLAVAVGEDAFAGGTSLSAALQHCATVGGTYTDVISTPAIVLASLTAGKVIEMGTVPCGTLQFLAMKYTVSGTMTAGAINASIKLGANKDDKGLLVT